MCEYGSNNAIIITGASCNNVITVTIITIMIAISIKPAIPIIAIMSNLSARSPIPIPCIEIPAASARARV